MSCAHIGVTKHSIKHPHCLFMGLPAFQSWGAPDNEALYPGVATTNALADYTNIHIKLGHIDPLLNGPSSLSLLSKSLLL